MSRNVTRSVVTSIRLPEALYLRLKAFADTKDFSLNSLLVALVEAGVEATDLEHATRGGGVKLPARNGSELVATVAP